METHTMITEPASVIRHLGRRALSGNWKQAVLISFLFLLLTIVPQMILTKVLGGSDGVYDGKEGLQNMEEVLSLLSSDDGTLQRNLTMEVLSNIYELLVYGPFYYGLVSFIRGMCRKKEYYVSQLFDGFEQFFKAFSLYIIMSVFTFLWSLLFIIPGIIAAYRYSMAFYLILDHPEMGVMEAIGKSKEMMKGNKWKLFCLDFSFIGWLILTILSFGIGMIWLVPYSETSRFQFYEILKGNLVVRYTEYVDAEEIREETAQYQRPYPGEHEDAGFGQWDRPNRDSDDDKPEK